MQYHENIRMEDPDRFFAPGRSARGAAGGEEGGQDPLHRLHRAQGSGGASAHAGSGRAAQVSFRYLPDAAERDGRALPQLRAQVVPRLVEQGIGVLGMKPMGDGNVLKSGAA